MFVVSFLPHSVVFDENSRLFDKIFLSFIVIIVLADIN